MSSSSSSISNGSMSSLRGSSIARVYRNPNQELFSIAEKIDHMKKTLKNQNITSFEKTNLEKQIKEMETIKEKLTKERSISSNSLSRSETSSSSSSALGFPYISFKSILETFLYISLHSSPSQKASIDTLAKRIASYLKQVLPSDPDETKIAIKNIEERTGTKIDIHYTRSSDTVSSPKSRSLKAAKKAFREQIISFFPSKRDKSALNTIRASLIKKDLGIALQRPSEARDEVVETLGKNYEKKRSLTEERCKIVKNLQNPKIIPLLKAEFEARLQKIDAEIEELTKKDEAEQKLFSRRNQMICKKCGVSQEDLKKADPNSTMQKCTRCLTVLYCSIECQRKDFEDHKARCKEIFQRKKS